MLEKTLESPLACKEMKPINPKGNQPWIFIGRTAVKAEAAILWPPDAKSWINGKASHAGRDWGQEEKMVAENEMVGWHHWLNGHEIEKTLGDSEGQWSLVCCSPWGCKELDTTWSNLACTKGVRQGYYDVSKCYWKNDLLDAGVPQTFNCFKKKNDKFEVK